MTNNKTKLKLAELNWKYSRHLDNGIPVVRDEYKKIVLEASWVYLQEDRRQHAIFAANSPAMLRQAIHACQVAKNAIENPDLDEGSRREAMLDAWRYLNAAIDLASNYVDLDGVENNILEPSPISI